MSVGGVGGGPVAPIPEPTAPETQPSSVGSSPAETGGRTEAEEPGVLGRVADVWARLTGAEPREPVPHHHNLDPTGARRAVALGDNGRFTATPGTDAESTADIGAGLYAAATLIDDSKQNLFDRVGASDEQRQSLFRTLSGDLAGVRPGGSPPPGLEEKQALQLRSSGATVMLELLTAEGTAEPLQREAFALYRGMIDAETNPVLRDGMVLHLDRLKDVLPSDLQVQVFDVRHAMGPDTPPYDAWFADGNDTVKVDWVSQHHATDINKKQLLASGFEVTSEQGGVLVFEKTVERDGVETKFEVTMRPHMGGNMYDNVGGGEHHMVVYSGHSNWGRNMRDSLEEVPAGNLGKDTLVLTELCVGKGEIQMFRDKFPEADMITTHNSSYFWPDRDAEGVQAFIRMTEGIALRRGYEEMAEDVHRHNPFRHSHEDAGLDNNFIFPTDQKVRRMVLDSDHDGQADIFDRLIDFDTFRVAEATAREFQAIEQPRPADALVGTKVHFGAQTINRMAIYSGVFEDQNSTGRVVPEGYFEPEAGESRLFRFAPQELDGHDVITMRMNARYAHMSEEAVRMAASFEYALWSADNEPAKVDLDPGDDVLNALVFASHSLYTDVGDRDGAVWSEFLKAYDLPEVPRSLVEQAKKKDSHYYSGSWRSIQHLRDELDPAAMERLEATGTGRR
jgi:hypothetical protein